MTQTEREAPRRRAPNKQKTGPNEQRLVHTLIYNNTQSWNSFICNQHGRIQTTRTQNDAHELLTEQSDLAQQHLFLQIGQYHGGAPLPSI